MSDQDQITDIDVIDGLFVRYLKIFGVWKVINDYKRTGKRNAFITFQVIISVIYYIPYIIFQCLSFFVIQVHITQATFITLNTLATLQIYSKLLVFWFRMDSVCRLYNLLRKDFLIMIPEYRRDESKEYFLKMSKNCNKVCLIVFIANSGLLMYLVDSGVPVDYILYHTGDLAAVTGGKRKILGGWYPVPMAESPYYEIILVYEGLGVIGGLVLLIVYVCMFYQLLMCLYAQFAVLGHHMSTLKVKSLSTAKRRRNNNYLRSDSKMYKELYAVLLGHQKLLSYANELRSVFNPLVTMVLGIGIIVLIISVFQFLFGGFKSKLVIRTIQTVIYEAVEVCIICFGSSAVETASSDLQFAIYSSDWYKTDTKFRRSAQMVMLRARKGVTLTAVRMYPVNVETIMTIFQFTYSVAALLSRKEE